MGLTRQQELLRLGLEGVDAKLAAAEGMAKVLEAQYVEQEGGRWHMRRVTAQMVARGREALAVYRAASTEARGEHAGGAGAPAGQPSTEEAQ